MGFFRTVEVFLQNYEVAPDAYLAQQYEIFEDYGGVYVLPDDPPRYVARPQ